MADMNVDNLNVRIGGRNVGLMDLMKMGVNTAMKSNLGESINRVSETSDYADLLENMFKNNSQKKTPDSDEQKILKQEAKRMNRLKWFDNVYNTIESGVEMILAYREKEYKIIHAGIEMLNATLSQQLQIAGKNVSDGLGIISKVYAGDIKSLGSTALKNEMEMMKQVMKFENNFALSKINLDNKIYDAQYEFFTTEAKELVNLGKNGHKILHDIKHPYNSQGKYLNEIEQQKAAENQFGQYLENIQDLANQGIGLIEKFNTRITQPVRQMTYDQRKAVNEYHEQIVEQMTDSFSKLTDLVNQVSMSLFELDKRAKQTALSFGYIGNKGQQYRNKIIQENLTAALWGKDAKDLLENQDKYLGSSDRGLMMSNKEQNMTFAAARLYGMENASEMSALFGEMNIFNTSIEKGADTMREMYDIANQMGVSNKKFVKDLSSNLKLAQKYNFVGGTKAMEKMSLWAQQVRLNLNSAAQFAEKLIGGGIEETLTTAANLQVLGGNAAIFSDPLGMMYDAGADMESMAHRIEAMVGNFGTLDRKTGETTFSWTDTKMMNEIAKALGMSREEVMNINREKNKRSVVSRQMSNTGLTEAQIRQASNRAYYDETDGQFKVNTFSNGPVAVKDLTTQLLKDVLPEDNQEALVEYAKRSLDIETQQLAIAKETAAKTMNQTYTKWDVAQAKRKNIESENQDLMIRTAVYRFADIMKMENDALTAGFTKMREAVQEGGVFDTYITTFNTNLETSINRVNDLNNEYIAFSNALAEGGAKLSEFLKYIGVATGNESLLSTASNLSKEEAYKAKYKENWVYKTFSGTPLMHLFGEEDLSTKLKNFYVAKNQSDRSIWSMLGESIIRGIGSAIPGDNVEKIGDGVIHNPMVASIDNADRLYAAKSGGALDKSLEIIAAMVSHISNQIKNGIDTNTNLNVNGNLNVQGNNIDVTKLVKMISNDTDASYELLKLVNDTMSKQENLKVRTTRLI
jgi:hypothetical protein